MSHFNEYEQYDAIGLAELVRKKEVSPKELLDAAIGRLEERNPAINAVVTPMFEEAFESINAGLPEGPFHGVPFLLKDLGADYKGVRMTSGSRFFQDYVSDHDSELVTRYKRAGLIIFGKTNTPEFGLTVTTEPRLFGPSRNPWDLNRTTGGSSGGAAAAVAARILPVAHASDGGGSIRIPASCCGLFGMKPTRGRVPMGPDLGEGWGGMSSNHVVSHSVRDSAAFLDVTAGPALGDPYYAPSIERPYLEEVGRDPGKLRIAFTTKTPTGMEADEACQAAVADAVQLCDDLGHSLEEAAPEIDQKTLGKATNTIINANILNNLEQQAKRLGRTFTQEDVEAITWRHAEGGKKSNAGEYAQAIQIIHGTGRKVAPFFEKFDILLSPVLLKPPIPLGTINMMGEGKTYIDALFGFFGFTGLFNVTGQPSMSVPLFWTEQNLPVGLQFTARFGAEDLLFRLAAQLEKAQPWADKRPSLLKK